MQGPRSGKAEPDGREDAQENDKDSWPLVASERRHDQCAGENASREVSTKHGSAKVVTQEVGHRARPDDTRAQRIRNRHEDQRENDKDRTPPPKRSRVGTRIFEVIVHADRSDDLAP